MRILQVNKFLYRRAGAEAYVLSLAELLASKGHEVALWGTNAPPMIHDSRFMIHENLLVDYLNFDKREGPLRDLRKVGRMIWSREAARKFEIVLSRFKPDIVHIHNIYHHISPSILPVAARLRVPVVMTVHDWHLINPNYSLFDHGAICERKGVRAIAHRCIKNSYTASCADMVEHAVHRWLRVYEKYVAKFLVPTEFVKKKLVESGFDGGKIEVVKLFVEGKEGGEGKDGKEGEEGYILYAGRLAEEKGIYILLEIAKRLPEIKFKIAGTGPGISNIKYQISNIPNVELLGFLERDELQRVIAGARLMLVPSQWYELSPLSVLEAMAAAKVVVASRIGGIPELIDPVVEVRHHPDYCRGAQLCAKGAQSDFHYWVEEVKTGFLIEPISPIGQIGLIIDTIKKVYYDETLLTRVGKAAHEYVKKVHDPEKHYEKLMEIYRTIRD